jgi:fatty acid elongase 3
MAPLADFLLAVIPFPSLPSYLTQYEQGKTPMSTTPVVVTTLIGYLAVIFGIQAVMKNKDPKRLNTLFQIHNVILSSGSALLLALMLEEVVPIIYNKGLYAAMCADASWTPVSFLPH